MAEYQKDVKEVLGEEMYGKLQRAVNEGKIPVTKAQLFAYELNPSVGGSFKNRRDRQDFKLDGDTFMQILGDYVGISEENEQEHLPDKIIEILRHEDFGLKAVARQLEKVKPRTPSSSESESDRLKTKLAKETKEKLRKRWEKMRPQISAKRQEISQT